MILENALTRAGSHAEHTSTRGGMMIYLLVFLIPTVALLAWAATLGRKRRLAPGLTG